MTWAITTILLMGAAWLVARVMHRDRDYQEGYWQGRREAIDHARLRPVVAELAAEAPIPHSKEVTIGGS
jgi:hypothetical protein